MNDVKSGVREFSLGVWDIKKMGVTGGGVGRTYLADAESEGSGGGPGKVGIA